MIRPDLLPDQDVDQAFAYALSTGFRPTKRYRPRRWHDAQEKFWANPTRFRAFIGGVGSGKTLCGSYEAVSQPQSVGAIIAPTYPMLRDSTLRTFMAVCQEHNLLQSFSKSDMVATLKNGTQVLLRTADDPERLRGPNLGWFYLDEAALMHPDTWRIMIGRLRLSPGRAWATTTPKGYDWLFDMFAQTQDPNYWMIASSTRSNPFLPAGFIESLERSYDEFWREQEIEGKFIQITRHAVFDADYLRMLLPTLPDPLEVYPPGHNGLTCTLEVWARPVAGVRYCIGADVSEGLKKEKTDESDGCVLRMDTWEEVAGLYGKPDPRSFAYDLNNVAAWYNRAEVGVENNSFGVEVVRNLEDLGANLWYSDPDGDGDGDGETPDYDQSAGMRTTTRTKGMVDGELRSAIVDAAAGRTSVLFRSKRSAEQCIHYVHLPNGGRGGEGAWHDDRVRSLGIAWYIAKDHGLHPPPEPRKVTGNAYGGYWRGRGR